MGAILISFIIAISGVMILSTEECRVNGKYTEPCPTRKQLEASQYPVDQKYWDNVLKHEAIARAKAKAKKEAGRDE